jgi:hypothetical protein
MNNFSILVGLGWDAAVLSLASSGGCAALSVRAGPGRAACRTAVQWKFGMLSHCVNAVHRESVGGRTDVCADEW